MKAHEDIKLLYALREMVLEKSFCSNALTFSHRNYNKGYDIIFHNTAILCMVHSNSLQDDQLLVRDG